MSRERPRLRVPLHPYFEALRSQRAGSGWVPLYEQTVAQARRADLLEIQAAAGSPEDVDSVEELVLPGDHGIPVRVYRPTAGPSLPALVYFFGGGWTLGSLDTADAVCRRLANRGGYAVVAAAYRLAPEHEFPAAVEDCYAATAWVATHGAEVGLDPSRVAVGGDSAGGNLAAAVTLVARDRGGPKISLQALVYPVTAYMADTPSMVDHDDPHLFNRRSMEWYWDNYLSSAADGSNPYAAPLRAASLAGLPPAVVVTAEHDPLRDEGEEYARRLSGAGVPAETIRYPGMAHGFFTMLGELEEAAAAVDAVSRRVRAAFEDRGRQR